MAAELRLGVSFDLVYFRQQLQKLGRIASSEFTAPIKIKLDRRVIDKELNDLQRLIKRRKYNVELNIAGNLSKKTFDDLQARLDALSTRKKVEIPISIKNAATAKDVNDTVIGIKSRIAQNQTIKQGDGKIRIGTSIKPSITNADVADFRRVVQAKLSGISVKVKADIQGGFASGPTGLAGLQEYMRTQGLSGGNMPGAAQTGRRTQFEAAVAQASSRELQDMMRRAKVQGRSSIRSSAAMRERLMQLDDAAMESVLGNLQMNMNDPRRVKRGFLDQVARAVFWMAGVDPEYLKRQAAQRRALPGVEWPATVPPSRVSIGPSGTGRALPAGAIPGALPGTAFGARGFLPPQLGQDLQNILRNAAFTFVDSLNARIRQVNVREIGRQALPPSMIRGLLPSAVGRTPATYGGPADRGSFIQNRIAQAYARSALRGASVMAESPQGFALGAGGSGPAGPYRPFDSPQRGGALAFPVGNMAPTSQLTDAYYAHRKFTQAVAKGMPILQNLQSALSNAKVPLTGAIRELGGEFGTAIKQVLLFGTAYKGLAFLTSLPGQAFEAAKSLQTFENQLNAVTGSTEAADRSFDFIDDLANRFNVPLQSARDGFVKLYASMAPAGFNAGQIETLFEGVSKATATFGLSADQVDRVNYAFAQMASKGQIMSEELKGQLGDVLPGALSLFAEAAGMSVTEFSEAMEDGAFKGKAMEQVLDNVASLLNTKFAGAASNASKTLQGQLNAMQIALKRMYESFAPIVDQIAANLFPALNSAISSVTQAVNAFGAAMQGNSSPAIALSGASRQIYEVMVAWAPTLRETVSFLGELAQQALQAAQAMLPLVKAVLDFLNLPFVQGLAQAALKAGALVAVIQVLASQALVSAIRQVGLFIGALNAMATGMTRTAAQAAALRAGLIGLGAVAVIGALDFLLGKLSEIHQKMRDIQASAMNASQAIRSMSDQQALQAEQQYSRQLQTLKRLQKDVSGVKGDVMVDASAEEINALAAAGASPGVAFSAPLVDKEKGIYGAGMVAPSQVAASVQKMEQLRSEAAYRRRVLRQPQESAFTPTPIDLSGGEGDGKGGKTTPAALLDLTRQLNKAKEEGHLIDEIQLQYQIDVVKANQEQEDAVGRMIALEDARHKRQKALQDLGKRLGKEGYEQIQRETEGRREVNRLMVEARFAAGQITAQERDRLLFIQGQIDALDKFKKIPGVTPDDVAAFEARQAATPKPGSIGELYKNTKDELDDLTDSTKFLGEAANGIGSAFAKSFTDILTGAQTWKEGLAGAFKSVASMFADMVAQMMAKWAALQLISMFLPGGNSDGAKPPLPGSVALTAANGAVWKGGFTPFANGGVVKGPTLGLVGEGRFNEAVVPLPDGKKIPVELGGGAGNNVSTNIVVNMNNGQASSQMSGNGGQALGREIEGAVRNVIMKESRPGGLIYSGR